MLSYLFTSLMIATTGCGSSSNPGCGRSSNDAHSPSRPNGAAAASRTARICPAPPAGAGPLFLPALTAATDLQVSRLPLADRTGPSGFVIRTARIVIDGTRTASVWSDEPQVAFRLADGRSLLHESNGPGLTYLWDPIRRELTELPHSRLVAVPGRGWLIASADGRDSLYDVDPDRAHPRLREVFAQPHATIDVVGVLDDQLALLVRPSLPTGALDRAATLVCVTGPGTHTRHALDLPALAVPSGDAIRGHRLLLVSVPWRAFDLRGALLDAGISSDLRLVTPDGSLPTTDVSILDLDTLERRPVGNAIGAWLFAAQPHAYLDVQWADGAIVRSQWAGESTPTLVEPSTERFR